MERTIRYVLRFSPVMLLIVNFNTVLINCGLFFFSEKMQHDCFPPKSFYKGILVCQHNHRSIYIIGHLLLILKRSIKNALKAKW